MREGHLDITNLILKVVEFNQFYSQCVCYGILDFFLVGGEGVILFLAAERKVNMPIKCTFQYTYLKS